MFRGGASLSKAYGVIPRLSEDVDITDDIRALVPFLWQGNVGSVLLAVTGRGCIRADEWPAVRSGLEALPIDIDPVSATLVRGPALDVTCEHGLSICDAEYPGLALGMRLPLVTLDEALAAVAQAGRLDEPGRA